MKKLFGLGDIKIISVNAKARGAWIPPTETQEVLALVSEATYVLYSMYRTFPFREARDSDDTALGIILNWAPRKVQKHRLILEKYNLFRLERIGTTQSGTTRLYVGVDVVALFDAGLPAEILDPKALEKLKKEFKVTSSSELIYHATAIAEAYGNNPTDYL